MGKHVRVLDWAPQVDILSHNKTKVFISHGGLKSVKGLFLVGALFTFL